MPHKRKRFASLLPWLLLGDAVTTPDRKLKQVRIRTGTYTLPVQYQTKVTGTGKRRRRRYKGAEHNVVPRTWKTQQHASRAVRKAIRAGTYRSKPQPVDYLLRRRHDGTMYRVPMKSR